MFHSHLRAGYPVLAIACADDGGVLHGIDASYEVAVYSATGALVGIDGSEIQRGTFSDAFAWAASADNRIVVVRDCQHVLGNPPIYRSLLQQLPALKGFGSCVILVAPSWKLPSELQHVVPVIELPLPCRGELETVLESVAASAKIELNGDTEPLLDAAAGLTSDEAENAFALSVVETGELSPRVVNREKCRAVKATGYLSVADAAPIESIGGLGQLKAYLDTEVKPVAREIDLAVRGILLVGIPGTGKSLAAKACGSVLGWPVVRLDLAACKGSLVGQSESNVRHATALAEAISPCILWIDEIEKAIGGFRSSAQTDGGTTLGLVGHLLTWLQEHKAPILTVATCNDHAALPAELTRAGRFVEFFVDLPRHAERRAIAAVHLAKFGCNGNLASTTSNITDGWTGAEIEELIKSAARRTRRQITDDALGQCASEIKPLSRTKSQEVKQLRQWAKDTLRLANDLELNPDTARKIAQARVN